MLRLGRLMSGTGGPGSKLNWFNSIDAMIRFYHEMVGASLVCKPKLCAKR